MKTNGGPQDWATPPEVFKFLSEKWGPFDLDACAVPWNTKCEKFFDNHIGQDALDEDWIGDYVWCNPPYGEILPWVEKAYEEVRKQHCKLVVMLLPADVSTKWFRRVWEVASVIAFLQPRIKFIGAKSSPPFGSMAVAIDGQHWNFGSTRGPVCGLEDWRADAGETENV